MGGPFHPGLGDAAHVGTIVSATLFAATVTYYSNSSEDEDPIFDPNWKIDYTYLKKEHQIMVRF